MHIKKHGGIILFTIVACLAALTAVKMYLKPASEMRQELQTYYSPVLRLGFQYPSAYELREEYNDIFLTSGEKSVKISMVGSSGQTRDAQTYLQILQEKNAQLFGKREEITSGVFTGYKTTTAVSGGKKVPYYVLSDDDGLIYTITGSAAELTDDIDLIISSFRRPAN